MKTKTQFMNRILSLVLSIMMVVSMLPASALSAFAADGTPVAKVGDTEYTDFATAVANWTDGTTLTLLADVTGLTERIKTYAKGLILDLNGHKIECSDTLCTIWIDGDSGSELTIRDGKGDGYIQGLVYAVTGGSKLRLESGTVETVTANGDFIMTGGQIICEDSRGLFVNDEVDVVISGGEIYGSNYGVWISTGNVTISGDTKITGAGQYAITSFSSKVVISGTPTISGGAGEFWLMEKITLNTQPADGETWRVEIDTEEITDGLFAVPGEGVTLDASRFASTMDGYDVKQNAKGELLLCNHQTAYAAVSNEDGSTHKMLCCCRETTVEASVACSGFGATCQTKAVCAACGQSYGETNPDVHTFNDDGKCVCGAERDAATTVDLSSLTATYVISDSGEYIFTGSGSYGIKVESGNPKIVLNNVNISLTDGDYYENNPINGIHIATTGGTTEILVLGESSITAKAGAGIFVAEGGTVKITGSSREDILIATGASGCSGIGGYVYYTNGYVNCGNIEISSVTVKAFGSQSDMGDVAPAIGGAGNANCGYITIDNADVYAEGFISPYGYEGSSAIGTGADSIYYEGGTIGEISIINDSKVYVTRGNYCDYIGCCGHENAPAEGVVDATAKSSTIYCYDTTDTTKPIQTLKYGALGGLLKEDGTCEGEHSGGTATCTTLPVCENCGASYGELGEHNINNNVCTECGFTYYNLWVGGVQVNSDNAENVLGDGTVSYDADTQTITLSDADISTAALSENVPALKVMNGNITLVLVGENKLTGAENCPGILIESGASVTVAQDSAGSLDVQGQALGYLSQEKIYVNSSIAGDGDFTVSGGTVTGGIHMGGTITITSGTVNADLLAAENVVISGGTVTAAGQAKMYYSDENAPNGTYGIYADNDIQISGGSVTVSGGYANITESYVPAKIPKASATAAMYAGNAVTVTGGTVTATGGTWNGYSPDDFGFMAFGSRTTVIDEYGKALKASSFTISDEASFTCGDGTPGNHSHSYADAACTSGVICAFCGISGESGTTQHTMDSTTGKCVCGLEMAEASATIGDVTTYYSKLDDAISAVQSTIAGDNATVKLLKDATTNITFPDISGVFTLDLNGNELKGQLNIVDSNTAVTVIDSKGDGKISGGYYGVHAGENSTVTISGGSISGTNYDIYSDNASITLSLGTEGAGATFPGGISVCGTTLGDILGEGLAYWQGKTMIVLESGQTAITGGDVTVKAACDHIGSQHTAVTDNHDGAHIYNCTLCGVTIVEEHSFENDAHKCVCGVVETFSVSWILSASLMQNTSTYGQDFTQTFTVPENTHLKIDSVYLANDASVPVNYTYENGVLTIVAEDVPAADVYIDCYHYVEVTFHANGGEIIPEDGFPQEGSNDIFPEDGSYWTQEWNYWSEICLVNCAEVRREGYTFVDWRDASGQVHQVIPGYGNYTLATEDITLYAQWQCNHTIGGVVFRDNGNGTHNGYCGECDELLGNYVERPHDFGDNTHKCVCGKKITPEVTAPTAKTNLIYDGSEQELINAGSTTGGTLQYSLDNVTWSAEIPTAITVGTHTVYYKVVGDENYEDVEAQSIIVTITDKTAPTGTILIKENGWNKFWNTITFGIFCKDYVDVTVTADGTGSGVTKVEYLLSDTVLEENNIPVDGWTTLNADNGKYSFSIKPQNKVAVYVRITDEGGNVTVINSDGIVVYEDSKAVDTEVTYTYKENSNKDIAVEINGNTVKSIVCSEKVLAANSDYTVDYESGKIVLTASYLDTLNAGNYTYTVSYNPMGVENSGVTDLTTTFIVKVEPTSIDGAAVNVSGTFTYDGNAKTPDPMVVLNGETLVKDRDYTVSYAENVNAGTATVTVTGKGNYSGTKTATFSIAPMELDETNTVVTLDQNTFVYDGTEHKPAVTVTFNGATLTEGVDYRVFYSQPMRIVNGKVDKWFGDHTTSVECVNVDGDYYAVVVGLGNFRTKDAFTLYANFVIEKATVTEPTIASKPYNGSTQTADITDTELYTVVKNDGGTGVKLNGYYDVVLKLKDSANYKWSTTDNAQVTLPFAITRAENEWAVTPSISGWTYGETANEPVGEAKFGEVSVEYSGTTNGGAAYSSLVAPTEAGSYKATFTVQETEDYKGLETSVDFTIAKKAVTVTANDASKTYGDSDPALTYTHTELVGSDALVITVARTSGENANTYTITASQAEGANPNYEITFKTGIFTIRKATLTVTAEDKTATYGDAVPTYTVKYEGFKNGDDKDDLGGALAFECGYAQFSNKGKYTIKASGYTSGNYTISYVDGKLTVNAKPITVTIQNATSVYGDTLAELKATDNGIVNGDTNVYSLATTATGTSNVGKYAITGTALDSNYDVTFVNGEYEITKREITITVDAKNTVVNTTLPTYTYRVEGLVGVDTLVTEPTLTCNANIAVIGEYDITASGADAGGNYSIKYVPAKLTVLTDNAVDAAAGYTEELKDYDPKAVTSEDKAELDEMLSEINTILADETTTDNGKKALEEVKEQVEKLIKEINDAAEATDTENTEKVENVTPENVIPENKTDLEGAKADLEKALEDNGGNYTEDEKKAIEDEIKRIDEALEVIGNVEAVEEVISKLPAVDTVKPDDEEAIKAITDAQTAYNALSDYEKSLVDEATKANLDKLAAALVAYDIVEGDGSSWTEDSDHNITFVVNGLFGKFVGIKVDGKDVDKANYEVKAGSTIITLKASYLDTLAVGEHTISVVYTDGSTDGAFNVHAKANSPATGGDFNIALYSSLMAVSVTALVVLLLASKKRKQAK